MKRFLPFLLLLTACQHSVSEPVSLLEVRIATISPLSGPLSSGGIQLKNGAQLAVNDMQAEFAKVGLSLSLVAYDDQADPVIGTAAARRVVADKSILGVVGTLNNAVALPVSAALAPSHVTLVSPANTSPQMTSRGLSNVNLLSATSDAQARAGAAFLVEKFQIKTAYVLTNLGTDEQAMAAEAIRELRARGVSIVQSESVPAEQSDFAALATKVQTLKPDALYFAGDADQTLALAVQLWAKGLTPHIMGANPPWSPVLAQVVDSGPANLYFTTSSPSPLSLSGGAAWQATYRATFGLEASGLGVAAYDAARVLLRGVLNTYAQTNYAQAGQQLPDRSEVETSVRKGQDEGLFTGTVNFDVVGLRLNAPIYIVNRKNDLVDPAP